MRKKMILIVKHKHNLHTQNTSKECKKYSFLCSVLGSLNQSTLNILDSL